MQSVASFPYPSSYGARSIYHAFLFRDENSARKIQYKDPIRCWLMQDRVLYGRQLPLKRPEFGQPSKISFVGGNDADAAPSRTHRDQSIVSEPPLSDLFVAVFSGEVDEYPARLGPVAEIRHKDSFRPLKIPFQSLHRFARSFLSARVELFEHDCTQPHNRTRVQTSEC
jgi:hypothetical protein